MGYLPPWYFSERHVHDTDSFPPGKTDLHRILCSRPLLSRVNPLLFPGDSISFYRAGFALPLSPRTSSMKKQEQPLPRFHVLLLIILLGALGLLGLRLVAESEYGTLGTTDFIQYWSASSLLMDGKDPYDPVLLQAVQQSLGRTQSEPLRM